MLLVSTTMYKRIRLLGLVLIMMTSMAKAQTINSPYSRFGLGDVVPSQNILTRGMGGVSAAYYDFNTINFTNPASLARLQATTLDFALELDNRTLRAVDPPRKFNAYSPTISYVQIAFPISKKKGWGFNLGLRPVTRVNYKIEKRQLIPGVDSINNLFEGSGGAYEANFGTGLRITKDLTVGVNVGYLFGSKDSSARLAILNDSVFHYMSNHQLKSNYGGLVANAGVQYTLRLEKTIWLRLGAYASLKRTFNGTRDVIVETFQYNSATGAPVTVDSVYHENDVRGDVVYPSTVGAGVIFDKLGKFLIGIDYSTTKWSDYRFFKDNEPMRDSWTAHIGGQLFPTGGKSYWSNVFYRAGFTFGTDYIISDNKDLSKWSATLGAGLPMRKPAYSNQFSVINILLEVGQRGNKENLVRESFFNIGVGFSLSDIWFIKRKFD